MNLLSLLLLVALAVGIGATIPEKVANANDVPEQAAADGQVQIDPQESEADKKLVKRSYGWNPWSYPGYGWPWYGSGLYHGLYPGWPLYYGYGYGGYGYGGYGGGYLGYGYRGLYKGW